MEPFLSLHRSLLRDVLFRNISCRSWEFNNQFLHVQAIVFYELAFHFNPHCAEACNNLGVIYKDRDNLDKAVECYQANFLFTEVCARYLLHRVLFNIITAIFFVDGFVNQTKLLTVIE